MQGFIETTTCIMTEQIESKQNQPDKELLRKLFAAQEDERRRIARNLHDELGQQLTALRLKLDAAKKLCNNDDLCRKFEEIESIAKNIDQEVDFLVWELRPAALDHLGLVSALKNYIEKWFYISGITAELITSNIKKSRFSAEVEINIYRIVQEALNNAYKHSQTKNVRVVIEKLDKMIVVLIEDDGRGFNLKCNRKKSKGIGLIGMKERAQIVGGEFEIKSALHKGTAVLIRIPIANAKRKRSDIR